MRHQTLLRLDAGAGLEQLKAVAAETMTEVEASVGLVYLLSPGERVLRLAVLYGAPREIVAPFERATLDDRLPLPEAIRQGRLMWVSGQEEIASRYPRLGLTVPYDYMMAASPMTDGAAVVGGLVVLWPSSHPRELSGHEQDTIAPLCVKRCG